MPSNDSFSELVRGAVDGDARARRDLFDRIAREDAEGHWLRGAARNLLPAGDRARDFVDSQDLVQTALRAGWLNLSDFRGATAGEFLAWLRSILRHKLGRVTRRRSARITAEGEVDESPDGAREEGEQLARILRDEVRERVRESVSGLPEDYRLVLELRLRGLSAPQIAAETGLTAEAVRKRESRAAARLRDSLRPLDHGE